mmetsp:Transcript_16478/g.25430  ORF Transcript_16478/g.25430 Transcript_16478/m.25430 type:complete len:291 (-) Transcript_16478:1567-2439(-)
MQKLLEGLHFSDYDDSRGATVKPKNLKKELHDLQKRAAKGKHKNDGEVYQNRMNQIAPRVKANIEAIQAYIRRMGYTTDQLHKVLDSDGNGKVDKREFVKNMTKFQVEGLSPADLGMIFDAMDLSGDETLSIDEFNHFLESAQKFRQQKMNNLDKDFVSAMSDQLTDVFHAFDDDGTGKLEVNELYRAFLSIGIKKTIAQCRSIINEHGSEGGLSLTQFKDQMIPFMKEEMLCQAESSEDLRAKFLMADTDYSGFLSVDELCRIFGKMDPTLKPEDVTRLLKDIDVNQDG